MLPACRQDGGVRKNLQRRLRCFPQAGQTEADPARPTGSYGIQGPTTMFPSVLNQGPANGVRCQRAGLCQAELLHHLSGWKLPGTAFCWTSRRNCSELLKYLTPNRGSITNPAGSISSCLLPVFNCALAKVLQH